MTSTKRSYFERMYQAQEDPWQFETSPYEQRKYALTVASLPKHRYRAAYEPGCSIGVLTESLARRCDRLVASDIIPSAVARARARVAGAGHVDIDVRAIPGEWPAGPFDLVVLSEIAYYFDEADLNHIVGLTRASTEVGGHVIGVHWRGETDYPLSGDRAHEIINGASGLARVVHHAESEFILDVWERT